MRDRQTIGHGPFRDINLETLLKDYPCRNFMLLNCAFEGILDPWIFWNSVYRKKKKKCSKWFFLSCLYGTGIFKFLFFVIRGNFRDFFLDHLRRKHSYFCYQDFDILYVQMTRSIDSTDLRSRFNSFCSLSRSSSSRRIGHGSERNCREMRFLARAREIGSAPI